MQVKTTLKFHLILVKIAIKATNAGEDGGGKEPFYPGGENVN
jgi:hypothetical protein